jgi:nucleoside-diphosphate-sugar epimerase
MSILLTGTSGFIGRHLYESVKNKAEVIGLTRNNRSSDKNIIECDLSDIESVKRALSQNNIDHVDTIIHLASVLSDALSPDNIDVLNQNNLLAYNVGQLAIDLSCNKVINLSSSSVYPNVTGIFSETSEINPSANADAFYGLSKYNSEVILNKMLSGKNISISHLRCVMVYGEGVNSSRIWPVMEKELKEKNTITVFGKGERLINQIHINLLVNIIQQFMDKDFAGIYNVTGETISLLELAKRILKEKGNAESRIVLTEEGNKYHFIVDGSKLKKML